MIVVVVVLEPVSALFAGDRGRGCGWFPESMLFVLNMGRGWGWGRGRGGVGGFGFGFARARNEADNDNDGDRGGRDGGDDDDDDDDECGGEDGGRGGVRDEYRIELALPTDEPLPRARPPNFTFTGKRDVDFVRRGEEGGGGRGGGGGGGGGDEGGSELVFPALEFEVLLDLDNDTDGRRGGGLLRSMLGIDLTLPSFRSRF